MDERNPGVADNVVRRPAESIVGGPQRLPAIIEQAGHGARFAYEEFFYAKIRNAHTRRAYRRAVLCFLQWCDDRQRKLQEVSPADVGIYLDELTLSVASKKQILAGLRHFFDGMVTRHAILQDRKTAAPEFPASFAGNQPAGKHSLRPANLPDCR